MDADTLNWPFFETWHRAFAGQLQSWAERELAGFHGEGDVDHECRRIVRMLGEAGWLRHVVPAAYRGTQQDAHGTSGKIAQPDASGPPADSLRSLDVRSLCIARETLARVSAIADFAFAMQGLGSGPISLFGSNDLKARYLPAVATGTAIAAFAISESDAGSDVTAMRTTARRDGDHYVIDGEKTWISNAGIADHYVVFCRLGDAEREYIAIVVEPGDPGFAVTGRITTIAPHPLGTLRFTGCRVPAGRVVGEPGRGLRVALGTLDVFRSTVGAAALGLARRALDEALAHAATRKLFGKSLDEFQLTQARIAQMATEIDASALLVYRAAWTRDNGAARVTKEAAMAKMYATEAAQRVIDSAVQLLGGRGVVAGHPVERLYRDVRALRIYEGTSEVQSLVIAGQVIGAHAS